MSREDEDFQARPGRVRGAGLHGGPGKCFTSQVMQAAKRAGHTGRDFGQRRSGGGSRFGRGQAAGLAGRRSPGTRRVVVKIRVVRHSGGRFRAAPIARHIAYLEREGVTKDNTPAEMFDAHGDQVSGDAFAARCEGDRHHFRFIVSPEDAVAMQDLRAFTRELMSDAERDLGTSLDWVGVDHWNTDNPHIHVLVRGRAGDEGDLVIARNYVSEGLRSRAEDRVTVELGPRSELEIQRALLNDVGAERWTSLDRSLRGAADRHGGVVDLRPGGGGFDLQRNQLLIGRAQALERLGLASPIGPASWTLSPDLEPTLRDLSIRGDIIKTMHRAMARGGRLSSTASFAIHGEDIADPVLGCLVERGLHDELAGTAYALVDGVDGRTHHVRFTDLDLTGDAAPGAIVELRTWHDPKGFQRVSLATRSDLPLERQIATPGATWLDRQLVSHGSQLLGGGFGVEVAEALEGRIDHLVDAGLAQRRGQRVVFAKNMIDTLQRQEMETAVSRIAAETGLTHSPSAPGEYVTGAYCKRVTLASGRFAMIDDGLGFQLVPWRPALDQNLGQHVSGTLTPGGGVSWSFGRQRDLGL